MHKFEDLRFSIGLFFLIVGVLLVIAGFTAGDGADAMTLNLEVGIGLCIFGALALVASRMGRKIFIKE